MQDFARNCLKNRSNRSNLASNWVKNLDSGLANILQKLDPPENGVTVSKHLFPISPDFLKKKTCKCQTEILNLKATKITFRNEAEERLAISREVRDFQVDQVDFLSSPNQNKNPISPALTNFLTHQTFL